MAMIPCLLRLRVGNISNYLIGLLLFFQLFIWLRLIHVTGTQSVYFIRATRKYVCICVTRNVEENTYVEYVRCPSIANSLCCWTTADRGATRTPFTVCLSKNSDWKIATHRNNIFGSERFSRDDLLSRSCVHDITYVRVYVCIPEVKDTMSVFDEIESAPCPRTFFALCKGVEGTTSGYHE